MHHAVRQQINRLGRYIPSQYFWPVIVLLGTCFGCILLLLVLTTRTQDSMQREREEQALTGAVRTATEMVEHDLQDYAKWDDAVRHVTIRLEKEWIDDNIVAYLGKTQGYTPVYVLDENDRTVYHFGGAGLGAGEAQKRLGEQFARSIGAVRKMPQSGSPIASGLSRSGDTIYLYSTAAVVPLTDKLVLAPGRPVRMLIIARAVDDSFLQQLNRELRLSELRLSLRTPQPGTAAVPLAGADGQVLGWLEWTPHEPGTTLLREVTPAIVGLAVLASLAATLIFRNGSRAIEALKQSEMRARHHADHDLLTGLPNRRALVAQISAQLSAGDSLTLLYMDLDGFKDANDVYGHGAGDLLLNEAARRIRIGADGALVARAGGDEFAVLLSHASGRDVGAVCQAILASFQEPFTIGSYHVTLGLSIGCVDAGGLGPEGQDELMRRADVAMYSAKSDGKNCTRHYAPVLDEGHLLRMRLEKDLQASVANDELYVLYQPIVDADSKSVVGVEALARWSHPEHGDVPPDVFIPIAEMSGLINAIGRQVLFQACSAMRAIDLDLELAVNLSPAQFWDRNLLEEVRAILDHTGFPPERLELEITESLLLRRPDKAAQVIDGLRNLGIRIALDDFGTGFASIGYLQRLKLDRIKIDKAFVAPLMTDPRSREMMMSIVALANAFGVEVTAEGVETPMQAHIAKLAGCARMQGWLFGRPASPDQFLPASATASAKETDIAAADPRHGIAFQRPAGFESFGEAAG